METIQVAYENAKAKADSTPVPRPSRFAVSVVIPAFNEERVIGQCLESLNRVDFPKESFEVIVVDNSSTDRTVEVARLFTSSLNLTVLKKAKGHISAVRNLGAAAARGHYLAFLDADMLVSPDWLRRAVSVFSAHSVGVIGAPHGIPEGASWVARVWYQQRQADRPGRVSYVASGNLLISRSHFLLVGGFDEHIETNEDCDLCHRARAAGLSVRACPEISTVHLGTPQTVCDFYRNERWHGRSVLRVFLRNISAFQNVRAVSLAFYNLLCLAGIVWGLAIAIIFGKPGMLAGSILAALLAPVALSARIALRRRRWASFLPLSFLYCVYGLARATCLLKVGNWTSIR